MFCIGDLNLSFLLEVQFVQDCFINTTYTFHNCAVVEKNIASYITGTYHSLMNEPNYFTWKLFQKDKRLNNQHVHTIWMPSFTIVHLQKYLWHARISQATKTPVNLCNIRRIVYNTLKKKSRQNVPLQRARY